MQLIADRNSHRRCFVKIGILKNFAKFTEKHLCLSLFLIKLQASRAATLLKRDSKNTYFEDHLREIPSEKKTLKFKDPCFSEKSAGKVSISLIAKHSLTLTKMENWWES